MGKSRSREKALWRLLARRLRSARGTAYIEFAVMVPVFLFALLFAADFTRILYVEQQVEIATRALCDVESHLRPGKPENCPGRPAKFVVRTYLAEALAKEGLVARNNKGEVLGDAGSRAEREGSVYCKGSVDKQSGPVHDVANGIIGFLEGQSGNKFLSLIGKALGKGVDFLTMGTVKYMTEVFPTDKVVKTSVSVLVRPVFPGHAFTTIGRRNTTSNTMLVVAAAPAGDGKRVRYYCHMPSMDTATVAPSTVIRQKISPIFGKWLK